MAGAGPGTVNFCLPELFRQLCGLRFDFCLIRGHLVLLRLELGQHGIERDIAGCGGGCLGTAVDR